MAVGKIFQKRLWDFVMVVKFGNTIAPNANLGIGLNMKPIASRCRYFMRKLEQGKMQNDMQVRVLLDRMKLEMDHMKLEMEQGKRKEE